MYGEVGRGQRKVRRAAIGPDRRRLVRPLIIVHLSEIVNATLDREVVEGDESAYDRRERRWNIGIAGVTVMGLAADLITVDRGMESFAKLTGVAAELEGLLAGIDLFDGKAMRLEPGLDGGNVLVRRPELLAKLLRREPLVVTRTARSMQILDKLMQGLFLAVAAPQHQVDSLQRKALGRLPEIVGCVGQRMDCSVEDDAGAFVDRLRDPACDGRLIRSRGCLTQSQGYIEKGRDQHRANDNAKSAKT